MLRACWTMGAVGLMVILSAAAPADSIAIGPAKDTSMFSNNPTRTAGGYQLAVRREGTDWQLFPVQLK